VSFQSENPNLELDVPNEAFNVVGVLRYERDAIRALCALPEEAVWI
jgi:hypothetical protein